MPEETVVTETEAKGWKTRTAAILLGVHALIGMAIYFIGGAGAEGAIPPGVAILEAIGAFGLVGFRSAIEKILKALGALGS